jgi:hypothetical protein
VSHGAIQLMVYEELKSLAVHRGGTAAEQRAQRAHVAAWRRRQQESGSSEDSGSGGAAGEAEGPWGFRRRDAEEAVSCTYLGHSLPTCNIWRLRDWSRAGSMHPSIQCCQAPCQQLQRQATLASAESCHLPYSQAARGGPPLRKPSNAEVLGMGALSKLAASVLTYPPQVSACLLLRVDAADGTLACQLSAAGLVQGLGQPTSGLQALRWR